MYLHIGSPSNQVSGREWSSMKTVGMDTISSNRSAIDRLMRNKFVEFLKFFVLITTNGTRKFPLTPTVNIIRQATVAMTRVYSGKFMLCSSAIEALLLLLLSLLAATISLIDAGVWFNADGEFSGPSGFGIGEAVTRLAFNRIASKQIR